LPIKKPVPNDLNSSSVTGVLLLGSLETLFFLEKSAINFPTNLKGYFEPGWSIYIRSLILRSLASSKI
jgi:hypothetical protein